MNKNLTRIVTLAALVALAACADSGNKIGSTVKGKRVAVMPAPQALQADASLQDRKPDLPPMLVNFSWPQAGYDANHVMPYVEFSQHPKIVWEQSVGEGSDSDYKLLAHPVADRGSVYTMDSQGLVTAFDAKSGNQEWQFDTTPQDADNPAIGGGVSVDGGVVYATTGFGDVFALDAKTGKVKWRSRLHKPLRDAASVANGIVYVVSIDNDLSALSAASGSVLWQHAGVTESATLMGEASPAAQFDNVVVAYNSGEVYDLRAQNGRALWNYSLAIPKQMGALPAIADIRGLPVVDHNVVYAISHDGAMVALDQRTGGRIWEADVGGINTPVIAGDAVFVYGGDHQLMALEKDSGRIMWVKHLAKRADPADKDSARVTWAGPLAAGGNLWMVNSQGTLAAFSPEDGSPRDSVDLGEPVYVSPIVVNRTMYVVTDDGNLIALR
ncbi:MAG: PQQ-binding-like beta-propeller repeat protein [Alphaproteobacteria bacterium]|nr:PQQ-binding-like beta-propeller repeat protein [Alphaproteobacteria bacterium]